MPKTPIEREVERYVDGELEVIFYEVLRKTTNDFTTDVQEGVNLSRRLLNNYGTDIVDYFDQWLVDEDML